MNGAQPLLWRQKLLLGVGVVGLAAFTLCLAFGITPGDMFNSPPKLCLWLALYILNILAWTARWGLFGKAKGLRLTGRPLAAFVLLKLCLVYASGILLAIWLVSAAVKWSLAPVILRAGLMLVLSNLIVGLAGGATINSILVIRRLSRAAA